MTAFFKSARSRRCVYWDRVLSLAFENITLRSWPTLMQDMAWLLSPSRSIFRFQLAVVCRAGNILSGNAVRNILWKA